MKIYSKIIILALSFLFVTSAIFSLNAATREDLISGKIVDSKTQKPISHVNVYISKTQIGNMTDDNGQFSIKYPITNPVELAVSHISYEDYKIRLEPGRQYTNLEISLKPQIFSSGSNVIVTATREQKHKYDIPQASEIVGLSMIKEEVATNLMDLLDKTPGFNQIWEYHSPLLMRGMSSRHMVVLYNCNRRIGTFPYGFMAQMLNVYGVDRIEVVRGPGAVMYGTGAVSGVINLITENPLESQNLRVDLSSGYGSNNNENFYMPHIKWGNGKIGIAVLGRIRDSEDYKYGGDSTAINSYMKDKDFSVRFGWQVTPKQTLKITTDYHQGGPWAKPLGYSNKPQVKMIHEDDTFHNGINYQIDDLGFLRKLVFSGFLDITHRDQHTRNFSGPFNLSTSKIKKYTLINYRHRYGGGQIYGTVNPAADHHLTVGLDGYASRLWGPTTEINYNNNKTTYSNDIDNSGISSIGMFVQDEWQVGGNLLSVISGLRYDWARVQEGNVNGAAGRTRQQSAFSGTLGLVKHVTPNTSLTLNFGRAFRMPGSDEMFADMVSGAGIKHGNPELGPEYSWNVDAGFRGRLNNFEFDAAVYTNFLSDFVNEVAAPEDAYYDYAYANIGKARISGTELSTLYRFKNIFNSDRHIVTRASLEYTYGVDVTGKDSYFTDGLAVYGIPPLRIRTAVRYMSISKFFGLWNNNFIEFEVAHSAAQNRVPENAAGAWGTETSEANTLFGISAGVDLNSLPLSPQIRLRIKNLFDEVYTPFGSYIPGMGRNVKFIVRFSI